MGYRDQHRIPDSEGAWEIVHDDGEVLLFDPVDYGKKAHLKLSLEEYYALAVNRFLQPEPPHHAEKDRLSAFQLRELELARDIHASLNHSSKAATLAAIKSANVIWASHLREWSFSTDSRSAPLALRGRCDRRTTSHPQPRATIFLSVTLLRRML